MRIISKKIIRDFWYTHPDCEQQLKSWYNEVGKVGWRNFNEVKSDFPSASILNNHRICFNIKGNKYRLVVKINFHYQIIWIRFIGNHTEYDKINALTI